MENLIDILHYITIGSFILIPIMCVVQLLYISLEQSGLISWRTYSKASDIVEIALAVAVVVMALVIFIAMVIGYFIN